MKSLIKSGICLALGWLATNAGAQEVFRGQAPSDAVIRPVGLSQPVRLEPGQGLGGVTGSFRPIIRGQAPDEKTITIGPVLGAKEPLPKMEPRPLPKDSGTPFPPPPTPLSVAPIAPHAWGSMSEGGFLGDRGMGGCGSGDRGMGGCGSGDCGIGGCGMGGCGPLFGNNGCCPDRARYWINAEYLMWWQRSQSVPPLVTTSPNSSTPPIASGVLGQPNTNVLYDSTPTKVRSGARFGFGAWLPNCCNLGVEGNFFFVGRQENISSFSSNGDPQVALPFFNVLTGKQASELVSLNRPNDPNGTARVSVGNASVHDYTQVWGAELNLRKKWLCGQNYWVDCLVGYRHLNISEGIDINESFQGTVPNTFNFSGFNSFHTRNQFNGGQIGLDSEFRLRNRMFIGLTSKIAFGTVHQIVNIDGGSTVSNNPGAGNFGGDLFATTTNIGHYTANRFAVLPDIGVKVGVDLNDHWRVYVGYDFLYLSNVVRPGEQIDTNVNPNFAFGGQGPGPRQPAVLFRTSDYWAQGLTFGLQYRW